MEDYYDFECTYDQPTHSSSSKISQSLATMDLINKECKRYTLEPMTPSSSRSFDTNAFDTDAETTESSIALK